MALLAPFRGVHYPPGRSLADLLAPPYDVISDAEHRRLARSHPRNYIHLTLGSSPTAHRNYRQIGARLRTWLKDGVLVRDPELCYYAYCQEFVFAGTVQKFWGLMALLHLEPFGEGKIFPHEAVHAGPVEDRLKIMEGTRANLESIIAMYRSPADPMNLLFESLEVLPPALTAGFPNGGRHRIWKLTAPRTRARIARALGRLPFFIADGHHRYHAAWLYRSRHRRVPEARWMMALVANTEQKGLKILPYHRTIACDTPVSSSLPQSLSRFGRVEKLGRSVPTVSGDPVPRHALGFWAKATGGWLLHLPPPVRGTKPRDALEIARLHELLPQVLNQKAITYTKDPREAAATARTNPHALACFLPALTSEQITRISFGGDTLPQKSTFFIPKPLSGLVLRVM